MGYRRSDYKAGAPRRDEQGYQQLSPVWRGVGCLLILAVLIGSWFLADWLRVLNFERQWVPRIYDVPPLFQTGALAIMIAFLLFAIITILYGAIVRPQLDDPLTVRGRPKKRRKRNIRRCR